jgi:polyhydroxyalkanoate synthesis regulator phasin
MAEKEGDEPTGQGRADALRSAVVEATSFGARTTRERAQDVADELAGAVTRVRDLLDELRPPDVYALQRRVEELEARVAELERKER